MSIGLYYNGEDDSFEKILLDVDEGRSTVTSIWDAIGSIDVKLTDKSGKTSLHWAAMKGQVYMVELLVNRKYADIFALDSEGCTPLDYSVREGHEERQLLMHWTKLEDIMGVAQEINEGCDINMKDYEDERRRTALHWAAEQGHVKIVELLLRKGASVETDINGLTPLHVSSSQGHLAIVKMLLDYKADINDQDHEGKTSLHWAAEKRQLEIVEFLLENGALYVKDKDGQTPFYYSSVKGHHAICEILRKKAAKIKFDALDDSLERKVAKIKNESTKKEIMKNIDVNFKDENDRTELHWAAIKGYIHLVKLLVEMNADVFARDADDCTPLDYSTREGHHEISQYFRNMQLLINSAKEGDINGVKEALDRGDDINMKDREDKRNRTAVFWAAEKGHKVIVEFFLKKKASMATDIDGLTPLHVSSSEGHLGIVKMLLDYKADINCEDDQGKTSLHWAAEKGQLKIVEFLLKKDATCHKGDKKGFIPLHYSSRKGHLLIVKRLLLKSPKGAIHATDLQGKTSLHWAAEEGHLEIVNFLLENAAIFDKKDNAGLTPFNYSYINGHHDICEVLRRISIKDKLLVDSVKKGDINGAKQALKEGAGVNHLIRGRKASLHWAAEKGHVEMMELLLQSKTMTDINFVAKEGVTALHYASKEGHLAIVKLLLKYGADSKIRSDDGGTPLNYSYINDHHDICEVLIKAGATYDYTRLLMDSARKGLVEGVRLALANKADVNYSFRNQFFGSRPWRSSLHFAAENGYQEIVELLLKEQSIKIDNKDYADLTPLHCCSREGHLTIVKMLLDAGADPRINLSSLSVDTSLGLKTTPLLMAAENGHSEVAKLLAQRGGINVNCRGKYNSIKDFQTGGIPLDTILHIEATDGHHKAIKILVECGAKLENRDWKGDTPLHTAAYHGQTESVRVLADIGANIEAINFNLETPLHIASYRGHHEVVELLVELGANVEAEDRKLKSPFDRAIIAGEDKVVEILVKKGVDIERFDGLGRTILHRAVASGNYEAVVMLVECGAQLNSQDRFGETPLHIACESYYSPNHISIISYLLSCEDIDPGTSNDWKQAPIELVRPDNPKKTLIYQMFNKFESCRINYPVQTYVKVFLCGNSRAGKSSLSHVIKYRANQSHDHVYDPLEVITGVTSLTAGIEPHSIISHEIGNIILYDFAGHPEYYSSHAAVLENLMLSSPAVFVTVIDVTNPEATVKKELYYWLNFIESVSPRLKKPAQVIVSGSHIDELSNFDLTDISEIIEETVEDGIQMQTYKGFVPMECHRPGGKGVKEFINLLASSCDDVLDRSDSISFYCHVLYSFLNDLNEVAISLDELIIKLREANHPSLPSDVSKVVQFLATLSDKGLILYLPSPPIDDTFFDRDWIIINKTALLTEVNGVLFAPESIKRVHRKMASNTGIIPVAALKEAFPQYDPVMLVGFLISLEFCQLIDYTLLKDIHTNLSPPSADDNLDCLLFFPSLIATNSPPNKLAVPSFGWRLWCPNPHQILSNRFHHVLLLRLALRCLRPDDDSHTKNLAHFYQRYCTVWINGIYWKYRNIEVTVEISEMNRCVTVLLSKKNGEEALKLCSSILSEVRHLKLQLCPSCTSIEYIIPPRQLPDIRTSPVNERYLIPMKRVAQALIVRDDTITNKSNENQFELKDIVSDFESYLFLSPVVVERMFTDDDILPESFLSHLKTACPQLMGGLPSPTGKSIREIVNQLSIFTGINPLDIARSCMNDDTKIDQLLCEPTSYLEDLKPRQHELDKLLVEVAYQWEEIANYLGVRESVKGGLRVTSLSDRTKLGRIMESWLRDQPTPATWKNILNVVEKDLRNRRLCVEMKRYLGFSLKSASPVDTSLLT